MRPNSSLSHATKHCQRPRSRDSDEIRSALDQYRSTGLTEKNRKVIRQIAQSDIWREVVRLPRKLLAEARADAKTKPNRAAVTAQLAIAILILIRAPVRMQNLASIRLDLNLVKPGGPGTPYLLAFPDYDVKNRVPLNSHSMKQPLP